MKTFKLPVELASPDQLLATAEEIHRYTSALGGKAEANAKEALSEVALEVLQGLPESKQADRETLEDLRGQLEQLAESAPVITLTLAAPPTRGLRQELVAWLRTNVKAEVLVQFRVNPDIAGGMVIRAGSRIFDCSFRTRLLAQPERFAKRLQDV